jgi:hypothetical protein
MPLPKPDMDTLYVNRREGAKGLLQIGATYKAKIINIAEYLNTKYIADQFVHIFKRHESNQQILIQQLKRQQSLQKN